MFGEITNPKNIGLSDLGRREVAVLTPILIFVVWIGIYPNTFLRPMEPALKNFIQLVEKKKATVLDKEKTVTLKDAHPVASVLAGLPIDTIDAK